MIVQKDSERRRHILRKIIRAVSMKIKVIKNRRNIVAMRMRLKTIT